MSLLNLLNEAEKNVPKPQQCAVGAVINGPRVSDEERQKLETLMWSQAPEYEVPKVATTALAKALRDAGFSEVSDSTFERHRKRTCVCFKTGAIR